jgi:hypothetical protein
MRAIWQKNTSDSLLQVRENIEEEEEEEQEEEQEQITATT